MLLQITEFPYFFFLWLNTILLNLYTTFVGKIPWRRAWQPTQVFLPGESPWTEPGGLQSIGLQRVGHDWVTKHIIEQVSGFSKYCQFSKVAAQIHSPSSSNESSSLSHPPQFLELLTSLISIILMGHFYSIFFCLMNDDVDHFKLAF